MCLYLTALKISPDGVDRLGHIKKIFCLYLEIFLAVEFQIDEVLL